MLISAVMKWRKEEDPDAPPPKWMAVLGGLSALQAFGMGALLMALSIKQWVFTLSAIAVIEQGESSRAGLEGHCRLDRLMPVNRAYMQWRACRGLC